MILVCPLAGINEPLFTDLLLKSQDTHTALVSLLRMLSFLQDSDDKPLYWITNRLSPVYKALGGPVGHELMCGRHMARNSRVIISCLVPRMDSNTIILIEDLYLF